MTVAEEYHVPVLLKESVDGLNIHSGGVYVDVTFGGGGHSREIYSRLDATSSLFAFDQDADAERQWQQAMEDGKVSPEGEAHPRFVFVRSTFRYLKNWMRYYGVSQIDGLLADLGVSSHHFDEQERGFSFRFDAPLDMRMNQRATLTAQDVVNDYPEERLADVLHFYGELKNARRIAAVIARKRETQVLTTTQQLADAVQELFPKERGKKELTKLFQALRIEVNHEMEALKELLTAATELLRPGGRLSVITYHSLEDRLVKNLIKSGNVEGRVEQDFFGRVTAPLEAVNNKVIIPDEDEQARNPRSRSAKLRIAEKKR